ncbi:hypothetical protein C8Q77DRAFT_1140756 [Trametes polyzona]|nr:hypothetical protein C8Q77DRAFT_1140756 [Trametes polyzona]
MNENTDQPLQHVFSPDPLWYAAIRIDPVETVKALDDPIATAAAQAMSTKPYLVFLEREIGLPFPNKPWYRYTVSIIAPSLRDADQAKGYTPEMCVPIYPNTSHPTERTPVRPKEPFPFCNCYHWLDMSADVRVLARPEKELFDRHKAVKLSSGENYDMKMFWTLDHVRILDERDDASLSSTSEEQSPPASPVQPYFGASTDITARGMIPLRSASTSSLSEISEICSSRSSVSEESAANSLERIMRMDIFSGPNDDVALLPLCELWEDLSAQFENEEDIPHPAGFFQERDEIVKIVRDARIRAYAATAAAAPAPTDEDGRRRANAPDSEQQGTARAHRPFPRLGLRTAVRNLRYRVKSIVAGASARLPILYIPVWP